MGIEVTFVSNLSEVMSTLDSTARERMKQSVNVVKNHIQDEMTASKGGRTYTHYFYTDA